MTPTRLRFAALSLWAALLLPACVDGDLPQANLHRSLIGTWEYVDDDRLQGIRGMSFFSEKHFAFVVNFRGDSAGYRQKILAYSGTYSLQDSIVTATIRYAHNPALIGQNLRWIHGVQGETASYKVLDKAGNIIERGNVRRLE